MAAMGVLSWGRRRGLRLALGLLVGSTAHTSSLGSPASAAAAETAAEATQPVGANRLVSARPDGTAAEDGDSVWSAVSDTGRYVAFVSKATGLAAGVECAGYHVYRRDRRTDTTELVDAREDGQCPNRPADEAEPSISADGHLVSFGSNAGDLADRHAVGLLDVFVRDMDTGAVTNVSLGVGGARANGHSRAPHISADGSTVVFESTATNLAAADPAAPEPWYSNVYRRVLAEAATSRVSRTTNGGWPDRSSNHATVAGDGGRVAYYTESTDIVQVHGPFLSNVVVFDVAAGLSTLVTRTPSGEPPSGASFVPVLSADGGTIAYRSNADNLVSDDSNEREDILLYDVAADVNRLVTRSRSGGATNGISRYPDVSADGTRIAFSSYASNLVARDRNGDSDVFLHDATTGVTTLVSRTPKGRSANGASSHLWRPAIAGDGSLVSFASDATNLVPGAIDAVRPKLQVYGYRVS